jgi:PAS domain S-box-containing protein
MTKQPQEFRFFDDDAAERFIDRGAEQTQSIDLKALVGELDTLTQELVKDDLGATPFGKLMEAVPIPVMLLDGDRRITFLNQAVGKIAPKYDSLKGKGFASLFRDVHIGDLVESLIKMVLFNRQVQVIESVVQIGDSKIWGRVHLQPIRWGLETSVLALIENLTLEKTQLLVQKKLRKELERRVEERTRDLVSTNERLKQEIVERKRAESELIKHRQNLRQLVVERTRDLNSTITKLKQEIKERKKAESSLRSSQHRLQLAFDANPAAVSIISLNDGKYLDVNAGFSKFSGYQAEDVIGRTDEELKYWVHNELRESIIQTIKESGSTNCFETVFRSKSGKMTVGSLSAKLIDLEGQPYILCVVTDVTDQKRAERDHNLFAAALDSIAESVLISDAGGIIQFANSAFEEASGYSREELRGQDVSLVRSPENDKNTINQLSTLTKKGKPWRGRLINSAKDGSSYEVEAKVLPVFGKSQPSMNFVIVEGPVDSSALYDEHVGQATKTQVSGGSIAGLALELNNIFATQMGYAYLAGKMLDRRTPARQDLERLIATGDRASGLINRLLGMSGAAEQEYPMDQLAHGTERILFIEPDEELASVGRRILETAGYTVTALTNVSEAISTFQSNPASFDLVISELTMPIMSGLELVQALNNVREDVRVLLCAGRCEPLKLADIRQACIRDIVFKPFSPSLFCNAVRDALD